MGQTTLTSIISAMGSANERRRYYVTPSLIGRTHTQNETCMIHIVNCYGLQVDNIQV